MRTLRRGAEGLMSLLAWHAGTFFPVAMLLAGLVGGYLVYAEGDAFDSGPAPLIAYLAGLFGVCMKVWAVFLRGGLGKRRRPTLLNLGFTYERLALALLLFGIVLVRVERVHPGWLPFSIPPAAIYALLCASMAAFVMVGWSELFGGGKRKWLQRRINPWPLPLAWVPRFFSERRGEGMTGHFAEKDGGDQKDEGEEHR